MENRLTHITVLGGNGPALYEIHIPEGCTLTEVMTRVVERLGQYEDTGLSPEDVMTMYKRGGYWKKSNKEYICSNCGKTNNNPTTFCPHCGCQMSASMQVVDNDAYSQVSIFEEDSSVYTSDEIDNKIYKGQTTRVAVDEVGNIIDYAMDSTDRVFEVPASWKVHQGHCCTIHGCKYGDEDCPVVKGKIKQSHLCYECTDPFDFNETSWSDIINVIKDKRRRL